MKAEGRHECQIRADVEERCHEKGRREPPLAVQRNHHVLQGSVQVAKREKPNQNRQGLGGEGQKLLAEQGRHQGLGMHEEQHARRRGKRNQDAPGSRGPACEGLGVGRRPRHERKRRQHHGSRDGIERVDELVGRVVVAHHGGAFDRLQDQDVQLDEGRSQEAIEHQREAGREQRAAVGAALPARLEKTQADRPRQDQQ